MYGGPPHPPTLGQYGEGQGGGYGGPPPTGAYGANFQQQAQGLIEDFQSLSMVPLPGSVESSVDPGTLPRPWKGLEDVKSTGSLNCHPRYLRLTTNAMPNAHSLVSRWHLPLGAVSHPLAEAPPGVCHLKTSVTPCEIARLFSIAISLWNIHNQNILYLVFKGHDIVVSSTCSISNRKF